VESLPFVIAGPCSAESEEQVLSTARELAKIPQVRVFRAGLWNPVHGRVPSKVWASAGLQWLAKVKAETGLLTTVEVANPKHVEEALSHGIDILWIGARTVVNPFSVQEIMKSFAARYPVMVKTR